MRFANVANGGGSSAYIIVMRVSPHGVWKCLRLDCTPRGVLEVIRRETIHKHMTEEINLPTLELAQIPLDFSGPQPPENVVSVGAARREHDRAWLRFRFSSSLQVQPSVATLALPVPLLAWLARHHARLAHLELAPGERGDEQPHGLFLCEYAPVPSQMLPLSPRNKITAVYKTQCDTIQYAIQNVLDAIQYKCI